MHTAVSRLRKPHKTDAYNTSSSSFWVPRETTARIIVLENLSYDLVLNDRSQRFMYNYYSSTFNDRFHVKRTADAQSDQGLRCPHMHERDLFLYAACLRGSGDDVFRDKCNENSHNNFCGLNKRIRLQNVPTFNLRYFYDKTQSRDFVIFLSNSDTYIRGMRR